MKRRAAAHGRCVAQTSKSAVSRVSKPAGGPATHNAAAFRTRPKTCGPCRFRNRRYSRFGNLRYRGSAQPLRKALRVGTSCPHPCRSAAHCFCVAQTSKSAVSRVSKPAGGPTTHNAGAFRTRPKTSGPCRFRNRRYSRFGNLRYRGGAQPLRKALRVGTSCPHPCHAAAHSPRVAQTSKSAVSRVSKPAGVPSTRIAAAFRTRPKSCGLCRFRNRRYSRFGNLRYRGSAQPLRKALGVGTSCPHPRPAPHPLPP